MLCCLTHLLLILGAFRLILGLVFLGIGQGDLALIGFGIKWECCGEKHISKNPSLKNKNSLLCGSTEKTARIPT